MAKYRVISVPYFPVSGLNTEIYVINLRIQFEYRKKQTRNKEIALVPGDKSTNNGNI